MIPLIALLATPVDLNALSPADALKLDGLPVLASVEVVNPPDALDGVTFFGDDTNPDGWSRTVHLTGDQNIEQGERVTVVGRLRVLPHPPTVIDGTAFPGFAEVRVTGWKRVGR